MEEKKEGDEVFRMYIKKIDDFTTEVGVVAGDREYKTVAVVPVDYRTACMFLAKAFFNALRELTGVVFRDADVAMLVPTDKSD